VAAPEVLTRLLGAFLLAVVAWRRLRPSPPTRRAPVWFFPLGVGFGLLNGLVSGIGPLMAPFFLAHGLVKGSYIGTDALLTVFMQGTKLAVLGKAGFLTTPVWLYGALLVPCMFAGALLGKQLLDRLPAWVFTLNDRAHARDRRAGPPAAGVTCLIRNASMLTGENQIGL
jgi:uncharacterized membrane protein YfcA